MPYSRHSGGVPSQTAIVSCLTLSLENLTLFRTTDFQIDFNLIQIIVIIFVILKILVQDIGVLAVGMNQFNVAIPLPEVVFRLWRGLEIS